MGPLLVLYGRCRRTGRLPAAGGVDDQEERVMRAFDAVDEALALPGPEGSSDGR